MTVNHIIKNALDRFGDPVRAVDYKPKDNNTERYYTFNYTSFGTAFSDDMPGYEKYLLWVHFFCPTKYDSVQRVKDTIRALHNAGTTWAKAINASDSEGQHIVFECEMTMEVTDG